MAMDTLGFGTSEMTQVFKETLKDLYYLRILLPYLPSKMLGVYKINQ